jgi:spoIIIJ-associated protein
MATEGHEFTGKTVDEAIAEGLRLLRLTVEQVDVEVLSKGSRGIFGLGSEPAHVRLIIRQPAKPAMTATTPQLVVEPTQHHQAIKEISDNRPTVLEVTHTAIKEPEATIEEPSAEPAMAGASSAFSDDEIATIASELLTEMVHLMGFEATVMPTWRTGGDELSEHDEPYLLLDLKGEDLGALIGRRGETVENLQYLLRLMVNQRLHKWKNLIVDVDGYKERRINQLKQIATRAASQVVHTRRSVALEPMPANERRIVHITLRDHAEVYTESIGEGDRRKVQIIARG